MRDLFSNRDNWELFVAVVALFVGGTVGVVTSGKIRTRTDARTEIYRLLTTGELATWRLSRVIQHLRHGAFEHQQRELQQIHVQALSSHMNFANAGPMAAVLPLADRLRWEVLSVHRREARNLVGDLVEEMQIGHVDAEKVSAIESKVSGWEDADQDFTDYLMRRLRSSRWDQVRLRWDNLFLVGRYLKARAKKQRDTV